MKVKRSATIQRKTPLRAKPRPSSLHERIAAQAKQHGTGPSLYAIHRRQPRKPMPKVSARGKTRNAEYAKLRKLFMAEHRACEAAYPNICYGSATHVHHKARRGRNFLVVATWMACCAACHEHLHQNPREARTRGFLI